MAGPESLLFHVLNEHPRSEMAANIQIESVFDPSVTA